MRVGELLTEEGQGSATGKAIAQNMPLIRIIRVIKRRVRTEEEVLDQLPAGDFANTEVRRSGTEVKDVV